MVSDIEKSEQKKKPFYSSVDVNRNELKNRLTRIIYFSSVHFQTVCLLNESFLTIGQQFRCIKIAFALFGADSCCNLMLVSHDCTNNSLSSVFDVALKTSRTLPKD